MIRSLAAALFFAVAAISVAQAVEPDEMLADPALEQRARDISKHLRCLVCQNQSIDDSNADLAHDLRVLVRERIKAGDNDDQVVAFIVARYGNFVLLKPPVNDETLPLWLGPFVLALIGAAGLAVYYARRAGKSPPPLSDDERKKLDELLGGGGP
jgi:cytochrome c-type biogenesis protein CcmH